MLMREWARVLLGLFTLVVLIAALGASTARAAGDPTIDWRTLETEHFRIHYDSRNEQLARRLAVLAEETHLQLVPVFGLTFAPPMDVVIVDDVDTANGSARVVDYNLIRVFAYAPEADSSLGDSDDWLRLLFIHEYIHILHMNVIGGLWSVLNAVFGKTYAPNQALPRWYVEGLATYGESAFTEGGRMVNNAFRMQLRMDALTRGLPGVENLGGVPYAWPQATGWYLYGSDFIDYVAETYGPERWLAFNERIGSSLSPIAVNAYASEIFGKTMIALWEEYVAAATGEFQAEALTVAARGTTRIERLTEGGNLSGYPRCRSPYEIGYLRDDGHTPREIATTNLATGQQEGVVDAFGNGTFDWFPNGQAIVYTQSDRYQNVYFYNDLFLFDLITGERTRLTEGERAREPAVSPDGRRVAYIGVNRSGGVDLREMALGSGEIRTLFRADDFQLASMPSYSPDGASLVFSMWRIGRARDLYLLDRDSGALTQLTDDRAQDLEPTFGPDGRTLYWSSDRTGIYNAYAMDLPTGRVAQLTNVLGGVFSPRRCSPDGPLFVRTYGTYGYDIGMIRETVAWEAPASYERPVVDYPQVSEAEVITGESSYNQLWRGLLPRSWSPIISQDAQGVLFGVQVAAIDPVGVHAWTGSVTYGAESEHWGAFFQYLYTQLPFDVSLSFSRNQFRVTNRLVRQSRFLPFEEEHLSGGIGISFPVGDFESGHSLSFAYNLRNVRQVELPVVDDDPADVQPVLPEPGRFDALSLGWIWSDARGFRYSLGIESGTLVNASITVRAPFTGADFESVILSWGVRHYIPNPWLPGQHLALLVTGGVGRSSTVNRPLFAVGGFPDQDILQSLIDQTPMPGAGFLRGYEPFTQIGEQFHLLNAEYRIPLLEPDIGAWTLPFFLERIYATVFADYGTAVDQFEGFGSFLLGVGVELRLQMWVGYSLPADFRIGYARGLSEGGIHDFYVLYGGTF